jgi:hypothetical protein
MAQIAGNKLQIVADGGGRNLNVRMTIMTRLSRLNAKSRAAH